MTEGTSLNDILSDEPEQIAPEPAQEAETNRDEQGRFAAKETGVQAEPQGEETVPPTDQLPPETFKGLKEEREKRQALERELEALKTQIQPQEPPAPPPSLWEDEDAARTYDRQIVLQQADQLSRINASEMAARAQHADFQEMYDAFNQLAVEDPAVVRQAMADPHPWGAAYKIVKNRKAMQELGAVDVNDLREKLKAEVLAELQQGSSPVTPQTLPPSLSGERSVAPRGGPQWTGPRPLEDLLR